MAVRLSLTACAMLAAGCAVAQAQTAPQLSPQAAYENAARPVEIVHRSVANWSDSELQSLSVAIKQAATACAARTPADFTGEDLVALARLCSLGQNWPATGQSAGRYIESRDEAKPQLALAYAYHLDATLHLQDLHAILATAKAMLAAVPYDNTVDGAMNEALEYLQLAYTTDALALDGLREPLLLAALKSDKPAVPRHALFADGLSMAALEQYAGATGAAATTVRELDDALNTLPPGALSADDEVPIAGARRQYGLLGKPLPAIVYALSLYDVTETPRINSDLGAATALLLFPDWCTQCVRMSANRGLVQAMVRTSANEVRLYALLAEPTPDREPLLAESKRGQASPGAAKAAAAVAAVAPPAANAPPAAPTAAMQLLHTPTLVVPPDTLASFAASDFPFLVVIDHAGIVRFAQPAPESALQPGDFLDRVTSHVAEQWPAPKVRPAVVK